MKITPFVILTALCTLSATASVSGTLTATLTGDSQSEFLSPFTIEFDDLDGDNLLDFNEITGFSGFTSFPFGSANPSVTNSFDTVLGIASVAGITDGGVNFWQFGKSTNAETFGPNVARYTYDLSLQAVPLPAAGWMLFAALGGIAGIRRSKKT